MAGMQRSGAWRVVGIAAIVAAIASMAWFYLETAPPRLGFDDTDNPATSLQFLQDHWIVYSQSGLALMIAAVGLLVAAFGVADLLATRAGSLAVRTVTAAGVLSAACLFLNGAVHLGVRPLLYVDGLNPAWGEAAYLTIQFLGVHGFAQTAIFTLSLWAVGVSVIGARTGTLPVALGVLGILPGFRLLGILGPFGISPDGLWPVFMASIVGGFLWLLLLGVVLVQKRVSVGSPALAESGAA